MAEEATFNPHLVVPVGTQVVTARRSERERRGHVCPSGAVGVSEIREGLEIDLVTHDVKKFFGLLLKKNGYVPEQLYSPLVVHTTPATKS